MRYKKCTDPNVFGFGIFIPDEFYPYIEKYKKEVLPYVDWFVEKKDNPKRNTMRPHITIKYLGCHKEHSNTEILRLKDDLNEIASRYLPLKIKVRGIKIGTRWGIGILLNYTLEDRIKQFHQEVIRKLGDRIDIYEDIDGKNFGPHIALGSCAIFDKAKYKKLKEIERRSRRDKEIEILLTDAYIYLKGKGPTRIVRKVR